MISFKLLGHTIIDLQMRTICRNLKELKLRAVSENISFDEIYRQEARIHFEAAVVFPFIAAKELMRTIRRRSVPPIPETLASLGDAILLNDFGLRYRCHAERFAKTIINNGNGVSLIFYCIDTILELVGQGVHEVHADGTFKVVPSRPKSRQLFTIHIIYENHSIPVFYALMEAKTYDSYREVISFFKETAAPTLIPSCIMTDFEVGLQRAFENVYGGISVKGCFFHYTQAVWKYMRRHNFLPIINTRPDAKLVLRMVMALPLLPPQLMLEGVVCIETYANNKDVDMSAIFNYLRRYWLRVVGVNKISVQGLPRRTNNNIESFHNLLKRRIGEIHPNIWIFLEKLVCVANDAYLIVQQIKTGARIRKARKDKIMLLDRNLTDAKDLLNNNRITILHYLKRCAYVVSSTEEALTNWANGIQLGEYQPSSDDEDIDAGEPINDVIVRENPEYHEEPLLANDHDVEAVGELQRIPSPTSNIILNDNPESPAPNNDHDQAEPQRPTCSVCWTSDPIFLLRECNHVALCATCVLQFAVATGEISPINHCPICRTIIRTEPVRVFYAMR